MIISASTVFKTIHIFCSNDYIPEIWWMFVFKKMLRKSRGWTSRERRCGRTGAERPQGKKRPNNPLTGGCRYYHSITCHCLFLWGPIRHGIMPVRLSSFFKFYPRKTRVSRHFWRELRMFYSNCQFLCNYLLQYKVSPVILWKLNLVNFTELVIFRGCSWQFYQSPKHFTQAPLVTNSMSVPNIQQPFDHQWKLTFSCRPRPELSNPPLDLTNALQW